MQRRKFIKDAMTGLPIIMLAPSLLTSSCRKEDGVTPNGKTVLVIGAGISGLAAATKLQAKGFAVTVLEAQEKVGGRLRTDRSLGIAFDEGASWIHGITGNPITTLAQDAGMESYETMDDNFISFDIGGAERSAALYDTTEAELYDILDTMMGNGNASDSFKTVFNGLYPDKATDRLWKFFLSTYVTFDCGDLDNLSSLYYNEGEEYAGVEKIATNGYDTIANYLAAGLTVKLNERVSKVDYTDSKVVVTHNGTTSEADYVLVTVPLGVLKSGNIAFVPALPAVKQTAIEKVGMNCVNKFLLVWDTAFWGDEQYISYTPEVADKYNYFVNVKKFHPTVNALMTFAYADQARLTEAQSDAAIIDDIMLHLKDMYGAAIPYPTAMRRTKWQSNENSFGSYSYTAVGTEMRHFDDLASQVSDRLFFGGEHTQIDYFSTAHGAYLSGIREANKIIDLLG